MQSSPAPTLRTMRSASCVAFAQVYFFMDFTLAKMPAVCVCLTLLMSTTWGCMCVFSRLKWRLLLGANALRSSHVDQRTNIWNGSEEHNYLRAALLDDQQVADQSLRNCTPLGSVCALPYPHTVSVTPATGS